MQKHFHELSLGQKFTYAGYDWVKLASTDGGALAFCADCVTEKAFDADNCNNWKESNLREYLNDAKSGFIADLMSNGANRAELLEITQDLTSDDGMTDYGESTDTVALITCGQYRAWRKYIPPVDNAYWTITPWTCDPSYSCCVRGVSTSGALDDYYAYTGYSGVRPLCNLQFDILVSVDGDDEAEGEYLTPKIIEMLKSRSIIEIADALKELANLIIVNIGSGEEAEDEDKW